MTERSTADRYIARVRAELHLPPDIETDILDEIRGHVADATSALIEEGLDAEQAEREALARLGAPDVLAEQLRGAHQTRRRLLAAAGGGIWAAGGQGLYGLVFGSLFLAVALVLASIASLALFTLVGYHGRALDTSFNTTFAALAWAFAAERGGRAATVVIATRGRRRVRAVARPIAAIGALLVGWFVLVVLRFTLDWPAVVSVLIVPPAFALGALRARDGQTGRWRAGRTWPALLAVIGAIVASSIVVAAVVPAAPSWQGGELAQRDALYGFGRIGPTIPADGPNPIDGFSIWSEDHPIFASWSVDPAAITGWHDLRLEFWRATVFEGSIAADAIRPAAIVPLEIVDGTIELTVAPPVYRDLGAFWFVVTAADPTGRRVRLTDPVAGRSAFQGSVIDWFLASDAPDR